MGYNYVADNTGLSLFV